MVVNQCIGNFTLLKKSLGKVLVGGTIIGPKIHSSLQQGDSLIHVTLSQINNAEIVFCNIVVCGYCQSVLEQYLTIAPIPSLGPGAPCQNTYGKYCCGAQNCALTSPQGCQIGHCPCDCYV